MSRLHDRINPHKKEEYQSFEKKEYEADVETPANSQAHFGEGNNRQEYITADRSFTRTEEDSNTVLSGSIKRRETQSEDTETDYIDDILGGESSGKRTKSAEPIIKTGRQPSLTVEALRASSKKTISRGELDRLFQENRRIRPVPDEPAEEYRSDQKEKTEAEKKTLSSDDLEDELNEINRLKRRETQKRVLSGAISAVLAIGCIYAIFLIFGVIMTNYGYNNVGEVEAQVMSVEDIKSKNNYDVIKVQYEKLRVLYEDILQLDAQLGEAVDGYAVLGGDYAGLMDKAEDLGIKTNALTVDSKYQPTKDLMYSWIKDYSWNYLVTISQALTNNDSTAADSAIVYKNYMYSVFANLTDNVITLGSGIKGVDLDDIRSWDPDTYKQDYLNGRTN